MKTTLPQLKAEQQKLDDQIAAATQRLNRLQNERDDLDAAERVLTRMDTAATKEPAASRPRGRPAKSTPTEPATSTTATALAAPRTRKARGSANKGVTSQADAVLKIVQQNPGISNDRVVSLLKKEYGITARANHAGIALARHGRAGRMEKRDGLWYPIRATAARQPTDDTEEARAQA
jgi:Arc/MetJ family transcription regulator